MAPGKVTVSGGTGFLGQRVVQHLLERDFSVRVAARHPERIAALFPDAGDAGDRGGAGSRSAFGLRPLRADPCRSRAMMEGRCPCPILPSLQFQGAP